MPFIASIERSFNQSVSVIELLPLLHRKPHAVLVEAVSIVFLVQIDAISLELEADETRDRYALTVIRLRIGNQLND